MKSITTLTLSVSLLASLLVLVTVLAITALGGKDSRAEADEPAEVVTMECRGNANANPAIITVVTAASSAGAPAVPTGQNTNCAQALADLLNAGFASEGGLNPDLTYTLIKSD